MRTLVIATLLTLLTACAGSPAAPPPQTVGSAGNPVLLVAYTPNETVRIRFEDQLETDLQAAGISNIPSHNLVARFDDVDEPSLMRTAIDRNVSMILMVRRVIADLPGSGQQMPEGAERHRTLRGYFMAVDRTRIPVVPPPGRQVIEVAGYLREGATTELVWSGYSWVDFDGDLGAAIRNTSVTIARNLAPACDEIVCRP
ncbi:MAG: hypothetical protein MK142_03230 [Pseudomonadales bacterium]|nr:hypothetical protein [Pseudomonadales bacterium]